MNPCAEQGRAAAFFDVDGTLVDSTIVHYYAYFRRKQLNRSVIPLWNLAFLVKCCYFLLLDRVNRSWFNIAFYRSYDGISVSTINGLVDDCFHDVIEPRRFSQVGACIDEHRKAGRTIVLVTGSLDIIMMPLARALKADEVIAAKLVEVNGRFSGRLEGAPVGEAEKARRIKLLAQERGFDLSESYAYGDSIADVHMLESVGNPHAVNPDRKLRVLAQVRGWPIHHWTVGANSS